MPVKPDSAARLPLSTISLYVLLAVADQPLHGYGIIKDVERRTDGVVSLEAGTLYAAVKRLQDEGLLREDVTRRPAGDDRRRRYYGLTPLGLDALRRECARLSDFLRVARDKRVLTAPHGS
jgi:DNA-binding PadR family transcriptional regulator